MSPTASLPAGAGVFGVLQDAALLAMVGGRVYADVPQNPDYSFVWYEIANETDERGMGRGTLPKLDIRTHTFTREGGSTEAKAIDSAIVDLMKDAQIEIDGFQQCGDVVYHESVAIPDSELFGERCFEIVGLYTAWYEKVTP